MRYNTDEQTALIAKEANVPPDGGIMVNGVCMPFWNGYSVLQAKSIIRARNRRKAIIRARANRNRSKQAMNNPLIACVNLQYQKL